ncbi:LysR family transcriptional regulator [Bosea robiniae]|uniref:LysR family transcriptional regulator, glycine cleavage system transcriptional activator n=1 Tax=Bosea robiniae TaxID=1036780 RepID=A0ABY0NS02_9HYPH|nr:LysR family transcriptional regulator [Bosea robiniae]SDG00474.1 LysR family transcriptional regulator, glycine cleavage system transcriptional activator [Bosea robiniae]
MPVKPPRPRLPSLNALRAFEAAARLESFAKAADEIGVTAGAVTQQIRQLEAALGFAVFRRLPQGVALTEAAREALPRLTRGFDMLGQAVQALRDAQPHRPLAIAALPCLAQLWLSPRLPAMRAAFPDLQISISAMEEPPDPQRDPYDLSLFYREAAPQNGGLQFDADAILPVCIPALATKLTTPADLAAQTLLHDAVWRSDWARWLAFAAPGTKVDPSRGPAFSLYSLALDACLSGSGVLMGRMSLVGGHLAAGRLVAPFPQAMPTVDRLTLAAATAAGAHPRRAEIMGWLAGSAGRARQI